jgi:hypothetical protein
MTLTDRHYNAHRTLADADSIVRGCQMYQRHPKGSGKYPAALHELVASPFGVGPFVDLPRGFNDPWGNPYRYALVQDEHGNTMPYVWAEREVDGELKLIGAKGTAGGKTVLFGVPR